MFETFTDYWILLNREASMLAPTLGLFRYLCQPVGGTRPAMTVCLPRTPSVAGMEECVWKYPPACKGKGTEETEAVFCKSV